MRKILFLMLLLVIIAAPVSSVAAKPAPLMTDAFSLIVEVNALRASYGLAPYAISPILMGTAQQHAEFMAANGVGHIGYGGTRPYQRALNAGYPLAGDLSLGGFMSENITAGGDKSVQQAVSEWQGDAPHLNTMLSPNLQEIGAGVAIVDGYVYYVIDCARPTGSGQPQYTPAPGQTQDQGVGGPPLARTVFPNTPNAEGKLYHIVGPGETLWLIAISYGVKIAEIRQLNYMTESEAIYPGDKLLIRKDVATATSPPATPTSTPGENATLMPIATMRPFQTSDWTWPPLPVPDTATPTEAPAAAVSSDSSILVLGAILLAALVLAGVLARAGRQA